MALSLPMALALLLICFSPYIAERLASHSLCRRQNFFLRIRLWRLSTAQQSKANRQWKSCANIEIFIL